MIRLIAITFLILVAFTKITAQETIHIAEAEAKSATSTINFRVNPNTANYDITYHKLEFTVDPAIAFINGKVTTTFTALENMNSVIFDLDDNLSVSAVSQNGNSLSFSQNTNDELIISFQNTVMQGNSTTVVITYSGNPTNNNFNSFEVSSHNETPILWTLSEPFGAKGWWPCKQDLNDKIDVIDVYITAPKEYTSVSNGLEMNQTITSENKTTHFKHQYPIPAYLIAIAVTNYETYSHTVQNNGNPFPILNYVYPEDSVSAKSNTAITVDIMNHYIDLFGAYPFENEKYGHAQFGWGGGMEHTTVSFMGNFNRGLIAHELAHQWFGDKVTCGSWKDIWLNEGFATYLSGLTIAHLDGDGAFKNWRNSTINTVTSATNGAVYLSDAEATNVSRIFNSRLSYKKGAMVLHMLRKKLGDTHFFNGIKNYLADSNLAYNYANTSNLIHHLEAVSNLELDEFFNDWIYKEGYPTYQVTWSQGANKEVSIKLDQTQSDTAVSFFEANVPIRLKGANNQILDIVLEHNSNGQIFTQNVSFDVDTLQIDPDAHLISKNNSVTLGLDNNNTVSGLLSLYPNPITDALMIKKSDDLTIYNLIFYNTIGAQVFKTFTGFISLSDLNSGIYFVKINTDKGIIYKTIIKK